MRLLALLLSALFFSNSVIADEACDNSYTVFYVNGMHTSPDVSMRNIVELKSAFANMFPDGQSTKFIRLYNDDGYSQYLEVLYQKINEMGLADTIISRYFFVSLYAPGEIDPVTKRILDASIDVLSQGANVNNLTYKNLKNRFLKRSDEEKSTYQIIFSHSQGNFYANQLLSDPDVVSGRLIGLVGIAVPANRIASSFDGFNYYITANEDKVINGVRAIFNNTLAGNVTIDGPDIDLLVHGLESSYIRDRESLSKIREHISKLVLDEDCNKFELNDYLYWVINDRRVDADPGEHLYIKLPGEDLNSSHHQLTVSGAFGPLSPLGEWDDWITMGLIFPTDELKEPEPSYDITIDDSVTFSLASSRREGSLFEEVPSYWSSDYYLINNGEETAGNIAFSHSITGVISSSCSIENEGVCTLKRVTYEVITTGSFDVMVSEFSASSQNKPANNNVRGEFQKTWQCIAFEPRTDGKYSGSCPR